MVHNGHPTTRLSPTSPNPEHWTSGAYSARSSVGLEQIREMATAGRLGFWSVRGQPIEAIHNDEFNLALLRLQIQTELLP